MLILALQEVPQALRLRGEGWVIAGGASQQIEGEPDVGSGVLEAFWGNPDDIRSNGGDRGLDDRGTNGIIVGPGRSISPALSTRPQSGAPSSRDSLVARDDADHIGQRRGRLVGKIEMFAAHRHTFGITLT